MDLEIAKKIGLLRHQIISPVLMETKRHQMAYFRQMEGRDFDVPGLGQKRFRSSTMKSWLRKYRKFGFSALVPKTRTDKGLSRKLNGGDWEKIKQFREEENNSVLPVTIFYDKCVEKELLTHAPICYSTLARFLKRDGLLRRRTPQPRKRYEMDRFGELWVGDFCHGPQVIEGRKKGKAILLAIIDDYSRYVVGASFSLGESTREVEEIFKEAILSFGLPDRLYVDNGPSFRSNFLSTACANIGIGLVHSKPYDSPSRGKIERFFRTVRERFLILHKEKELTLMELNEKFRQWLGQEYHLRKHSSLDVRPVDRYQSSIQTYPLKRIAREQLDEFFMVSITRDVRKDSTISLDSIFYEAPSIYIGRKVQIRHVQGDSKIYYLYEDNKKICEIRPVDSKANGKSYRPTPRENIITFHKKEK